MPAATVVNEEKDLQEQFHKVTPIATVSESNKAAIGTEGLADKNCIETDVVDFEENDPRNPVCWPKSKKWLIVILVSLTLMMDTIGTTSIVPAAPQVLAEFGNTSTLDLVLLVSIWELGEGIGPFCYAPLAELYGRLPIYHAGNVLFVLFMTASALSTNMPMLIGLRFMCGFVSTTVALGPAIIGDLFETNQRGMVMSISTALLAIGPVIAPIMGSYIAQAKGWRWTIWVVAIAAGVLMVVSFIFFRETYHVKILERKARRLRETTGNTRLKSRLQTQVDQKSRVQLLMRPIMMLVFSPAVLIVSLYSAFANGINYLVFTTLTKILEKRYGFREGPVGVAFLALTIGNILAMCVYGMLSDRYLKNRRLKAKTVRPEHRLVFTIAGAVILPVGLFLYGWTTQYDLQWMAPLIGTGIIGFATVLTIIASRNYIVDIHKLYAVSALAANNALRALFCTSFPLLATPLYWEGLGLGWGNSVLGFVAVGLVPVAILMLPYGEGLRNASRVVEHID